ncbi:hypothetical protein H6802_04485 [Candidatus Nomurabacteria bacterium]|uniref:Uncharacterized protein n=1 Tax=candidate division WWE3 bacterium TaxID=2053526 RepID=A0A955IX00_UNCKA|nr:hypothetical protein [candidate division WWE3 bacterium]MCB9824177.1 hypothetical protein [Candidatus Nomurabacteria bacterium]MCB9826852.1 hypothetical protein [Candidatus Nomurabacteria bacterium]MCB9828118.1 hypothetical protein [Candidatus Nomurabacteria bacterium]HXK52438.1 hypothetical protein [bacterium]
MNLVKASVIGKRLTVILAILLVLYILFLITKPAVISAFYYVFPPKDLPNPIFGMLDPLEFVEKPVANNNFSIELNTSNGRLPAGMPTRMKVYEFAPDYFSYEAGRAAQDNAQKLGFTDDELITDLKGDLYSWRSKISGGTLNINKNTKSLELKTPLVGKNIMYKAQTISSGSAAQGAISILTQINRFSDPLYSKGTNTVTFGKIQGNNLTMATNNTEIQFARVDFFRQIETVPILGPNPKIGLINVTLSAAKIQNTEMNYPFMTADVHEIIPNTEATYPIIPIDEAWAAVVSGKGVVVNVTPKGSSVFDSTTAPRVDRALIENIYMAYYETPEKQQYLQPIYVFDGKYNIGNAPGGEITIYYPAIQGQYIKPLEAIPTTPTPITQPSSPVQ